MSSFRFMYWRPPSWTLSRLYHGSRQNFADLLKTVEPRPNIPPFSLDQDLMQDLVQDLIKIKPTSREVNEFVKGYHEPESSLTKKEDMPPPIQTEVNHYQHRSLHKEQKHQQKQHLHIQAAKNRFIDTLFSPPIQHIALIKIQGPLTDLHLKYVSKTLAYLQRLGLMSVAVLDNENWKILIKQESFKFNDLLQKMIEDAGRISAAIENAGCRSTPMYNGVFTLAKKNSNLKDETNVDNKSQQRRKTTSDGSGVDVSLTWLKSSLRLGQIPLILPIALDKSSVQRVIPANSGMIALSYALRNLSDVSCLKNPEQEPMKVVVINSEGGIPSGERRFGSHVFINMTQEYEEIKESFKVNAQWNYTHPSGLENLEMMKACLEHLPSTTSGIIVPTYAPTGLIANLITNKPLFSSSLPISSPTTPTTTTTVLRAGMEVVHHNSLTTIEMPALRQLIEASFRRKLDFEPFIKRLDRCLDSIIVAGNYEGAAVITTESETDGEVKVPYLDKLAVAPNSQGIGVVDVLWKRMQTRYPNLMWRSRYDNKVNKWYFERSDGNCRVPGTKWMLFWYGVDDINCLKNYTKIAQQIPASFLD